MLPSQRFRAQHSSGAASVVRRTPNNRRGDAMAEVKITFDAADDYERYMGRWSRTIGQKFLAWLDAPKGARWLDVGCGTGAFSELILRHCEPASLDGIDPSPEQIEYARK